MNTIWVNEKPLKVDLDINIYQLLEQINSPSRGVAVAINNEIHSHDNWKSTFLKNNDQVLIIQAIQGG